MELYEFPTSRKPVFTHLDDLFGETFGEHYKWNPRHKIIYLLDSQRLKMGAHIFCRIVDDGDARVVKMGAHFFDENRINLKDNQLTIRLESVEYEPSNHAITRP